MKRILVYGLSDNIGGIETFFLNYYQELHKKTCIFDFITDYQKLVFEEELQAQGSSIYHIPSKKQNPIQHIYSFYTILQEHPEYEIVYFNIITATVFITLLSTLPFTGLTRIIHSHNNSAKHALIHLVFRPLLNILKIHRLACSQEAGLFMFHRKPFTIIHNAIHCERYKADDGIRNAVREELHLQNKLVIGHVGKFCYQKNTLYLLSIFKEIHSINPDAILLLIGDGEDHDAVIEAIHSLAIENCCILTGMTTRVPDYLQAMDVFVLPSRFEGFPLVAIEAQAAGLPCLLSSAITPDIAITPLVTFLSIQEHPAVWANRLMDILTTHEVSDPVQQLQSSGYDIKLEAEKFSKLLLSFGDN